MYLIHRRKHQDDKNCLKCQYEDLYQAGKKIFEEWDQKGTPPKELLKIQKQLLKLKKQIEKAKIDSSLEFCAEHPEVYEYLPLDWI